MSMQNYSAARAILCYDDYRGDPFMNLLWLIVSGEFGERLSQDLRAAGYAITEVASTGDFLNFGNMILLLSVEKREVDAATALIRQKMNEYRHLDAFDQDALPGSDIAIYDIPLYQYAKVGKGPIPEQEKHASADNRTEPA